MAAIVIMISSNPTFEPIILGLEIGYGGIPVYYDKGGIPVYYADIDDEIKTRNVLYWYFAGKPDCQICPICKSQLQSYIDYSYIRLTGDEFNATRLYCSVCDVYGPPKPSIIKSSDFDGRNTLVH